MSTNLEIADRLAVLKHRIHQLAPKASLIAVSKTQPLMVVRAAAAAGQLDFGENYVQEGVEKIASLRSELPHLQWHMIGPLQSNKTGLVATHFDWVHSVDRLKIAERLSAARPTSLTDLNVLIQVNIDEEQSKSGVMPNSLWDLAHAISRLPKLRLRGLMCIPEKGGFDSFARMQALYQQSALYGLTFDSLSMGMSADFESALAHGATHVRVGTAIFGARAL